jgi:Txe/YoeB family toxin of Txe-Axe toxin-antitoxin module
MKLSKKRLTISKICRFEDREMYDLINRAMEDIKQNLFIGIHIPQRVWPKIYIQKYKINNLWKYDLRNDWRLIYTIKGSEIEIVSIILEWMNHTEYNQRFKY